MAIALSADAEPVKLSDYVTTLPETHSIAIFIGAMARGEDNFADDVVDQKISISKYSLSASVSSWRSWRTLYGFSYSLRNFFRSPAESSVVPSRTCGMSYNLGKYSCFYQLPPGVYLAFDSYRSR
jgi:hypothetical protein